MDGVLCDFEAKVEQLNAFKDTINKNGKRSVDWTKLDQLGPSTWSSIKWLNEGRELYNYLVPFCKRHDIELGILSALYLQNGKIGKREWLAKHCPDIKRENILIIDNGLAKPKFGNKDTLLIDDNKDICDAYAKIGPSSHFERNPLHNYYEAILNYYLVR